jgi:threonylcarbamoyladenosine tRNA methylthiotransferase MtaB
MGVEVVTFGCRLNLGDGAAVAAAARAAGLSDTVFVNGCAVTSEAMAQARQAARRARRERPGARIVVTGCSAQVEPEAFARMPEVDHVIGTREKLGDLSWLGRPDAPRVAVSDLFANETPLRAPSPPEDGAHTRVFLQVQTGCDHRCTFCVIPFGRGNARSVPLGDVIASARASVEGGAREIVLTGVDLTSWGNDLAGRPRLGALVRALLKAVPDLPRLRLSSIDQVEADPDLIAALAEEERLMPHLHLSLQHGDDLILKRMKRRHARADALAFCELARRLRPGIVLTADLIAGFPTETAAHAAANESLIDDCGLANAHVFPYSPRSGTPAARMPQLAPALVKDRAARLRARAEAAWSAHLDAAVGRRDVVLSERGEQGRTRCFTPARLPPGTPPNRLIDVVLTGRAERALIAEPA